MGVRPPPPLRLCDASASASASLRRILCSSLVRMPSNVSPLKLQSSRSSSSKLSPATACAEIALPPLCTAQARAPIGGLLQLLQRDDSGQQGRLIAIVEMGPPLDAACSLRLVRRPAHWSLFSRRIRRGECLHLFLCTGRLGSLPPTTFAQYRYWLQGTVVYSTRGRPLRRIPRGQYNTCSRHSILQSSTPTFPLISLSRLDTSFAPLSLAGAYNAVCFPFLSLSQAAVICSILPCSIHSAPEMSILVHMSLGIWFPANRQFHTRTL